MFEEKGTGGLFPPAGSPAIFLKFKREMELKTFGHLIGRILAQRAGDPSMRIISRLNFKKIDVIAIAITRCHSTHVDFSSDATKRLIC